MAKCSRRAPMMSLAGFPRRLNGSRIEICKYFPRARISYVGVGFAWALRGLFRLVANLVNMW